MSETKETFSGFDLFSNRTKEPLFLPYFVAGGFSICMTELFENIVTIASRVAGYTVKEIRNKKIDKSRPLVI